MSPTPQHPRDAPSDGLRTARAVADRLDEDVLPRLVGLEEAVRDVGHRVDKLTRGFAILTTRQAAPAAGQPDWIGCHDVGEATAMLLNARQWVHDYGVHLGVGAPPCWAYHPDMVALLMAAALQHKAAYGGDSPLSVIDFHIRIRPGVDGQITHLASRGKTRCHQTAHYIGDDAYSVDHAQLEDLAAWWAGSREGLPPGLTWRDPKAGAA